MCEWNMFNKNTHPFEEAVWRTDYVIPLATMIWHGGRFDSLGTRQVTNKKYKTQQHLTMGAYISSKIKPDWIG